MRIDPNAPAFPITMSDGVADEIKELPELERIDMAQRFLGMTVRMELAKAAMQGFLANPTYSGLEIAGRAVAQADALIAELNK